jgi:hypothetical protein
MYNSACPFCPTITASSTSILPANMEPVTSPCAYDATGGCAVQCIVAVSGTRIKPSDPIAGAAGIASYKMKCTGLNLWGYYKIATDGAETGSSLSELG